MTILSSKLRRSDHPKYGTGELEHWCPGCETVHGFAIDKPNYYGAKWVWDGNVEKPSFTPSMNITVNPTGNKYYQAGLSTDVCHYFLKAGEIQFLNDCTHKFKGQTVSLPDLPNRYAKDWW